MGLFTKKTKAARQPIQWQRIYRQTLTLIRKNFLLFYASPISTLLRALLFPLIAAAVLCSLKYIQSSSSSHNDSGFADVSKPIPELSRAMKDISRNKLVFVANGTSSLQIIPIMDGIKKLPGMDKMEVAFFEDTNSLFLACKQSVTGSSSCYAAVVFSTFSDGYVEYSIGMDDSLASGHYWGNWRRGNTIFANFIYPLQWAIESQIGGFTAMPKPTVLTWNGVFGPNSYTWSNSAQVQGGKTFWVSMVSIFVGPVFILLLIGVIYHEATQIATERESSMAELLASHQVTIVPRILSTCLSFFILYFPGFLGSSLIMTQILFVRTSDILLIFLTLLAGASFITSTHFIASFFGKANLAGLYSSTLAFALALITIASTLTVLDVTARTRALSLIFPPYAWATLIEDVAHRETNGYGFTLQKPVVDPELDEPDKLQLLDGSLYVIFFVVQTIVYALAAYVVEKYLWGVTKQFDRIAADSDVAVRCTGLSKTYFGKRRFYAPWSRKGEPLKAVDDLSLEIKKGSVTFLLGPNGGGKTTTLKCISGMTSFDNGSRLEINEAGTVFGICPQSNVYWTGLTVRQHIYIWTNLKRAALPSSEEDDVIAECDLESKIDVDANNLSGGQMRKLQLAIAFCGGSKVCCIDEASSGLDPLSRRNIWNIIQKGHSRRTVLVTTHFLDEADVLADQISIVYKGKLVCEGPGTTLKARFGDEYLIRSNDASEGDSMVWRTASSVQATRKLLELESLDNDNTYDVVFPTLEQVFLKVTSDTAVHAHNGDGFVGELEPATVLEEKIFALETEHQQDIDLEVGSSIGFGRQIQALFTKRYVLLRQKSSWIAYLINFAIPVVIAAAISGFLRKEKDFKPHYSCDMIIKALREPVASEISYGVNLDYPVFARSSTPQFYLSPERASALLAPQSAWEGDDQDDIYTKTIGPRIYMSMDRVEDGRYIYEQVVNETALNEAALASRKFSLDTDGLRFMITNYSGYGYSGFGIWSPPDEAPTIFLNNVNYLYGAAYSTVLNLVTNRLSNSTSNSSPARIVSTNLLQMRQPVSETDFRYLPIGVLVVLAFIAATSIAAIYPAYEKINNVRALHYCNGVSPAALWIGYLLFDLQFIIVQSLIVWGAMYFGVSRLYYASSYLLGVFILFGIATYLGSYLLSLFVKKAAFAVAAGVHILLVVFYLVSYVVVEAAGNKATRHATFSLLQYVLGLTSPAANLLRALFIATNSFAVLCGQFADNDVSNPMGYKRYGSPYVNLLIQIAFLASALAIYEYGSADFFRRHVINRGIPSRLHYRVEEGGQEPAPSQPKTEKDVSAIVAESTEILKVSSISKYFGKNFAVENVSFNISSNETLALLGGNGAGKTTVINMIRGELKPNFGDIFLDGTSVLKNPSKVRLQMGVCPQDDAVDNLTVRQTLRFYAAVKGLKNVEANVDKVLLALNITVYEGLPVKALSGGTKRKLSVAIALLGNPRILLLDEPSTGQDAGAKRILWRALKDISSNRAILLTTHSMEEAEALATNVAIMGTRMLATGTLSSLQESHGGAYMIRAVRAEGTTAEEVERNVKDRFEGKVKHYYDSHGQITFGLPHDRSLLGSIMRQMEELKGERLDEDAQTQQLSAGGSSAAAGGSSTVEEKSSNTLLSDYTINGPTLEEVFMNVAREAGVAGGA